LIFINSIFAKDAHKSRISIYGDTTFTTNNIYRGRVYGSALQGSMYIEDKSGVYTGVWATSTMGFGTLFDVSLGYNTSIDKFKIDIGMDYALFTYKSAYNSFESYLGVCYVDYLDYGVKFYDNTTQKLGLVSIKKSFDIYTISLECGNRWDSNFVDNGYYSLQKIDIDIKSLSAVVSFVATQSPSLDDDIVPYGIYLTRKF
jgi:hypothetical protein